MCTTASSSTSSVEGYLLFQFPQTHLQPNGQTTSIFSASATILPSLSPPLIFIFRERKKEQQQQQMDFPDPAFANSSAHKNQTNQFKNHSQFSLLLFFKEKGRKMCFSYLHT